MNPNRRNNDGVLFFEEVDLYHLASVDLDEALKHVSLENGRFRFDLSLVALA